MSKASDAFEQDVGQWVEEGVRQEAGRILLSREILREEGGGGPGNDEAIESLQEYLGGPGVTEWMGGGDSRAADILVREPPGGDGFFIECKMGRAQAGQFVALPDRAAKRFSISDASEMSDAERETAEQILAIMDGRFDEIDGSAKGVNVSGLGGDAAVPPASRDGGEIEETVALEEAMRRLGARLIERHYGDGSRHEAAFIVAGGPKNKYVMTPGDVGAYYGDIACWYRRKRSGSRKWPRSRDAGAADLVAGLGWGAAAPGDLERVGDRMLVRSSAVRDGDLSHEEADGTRIGISTSEPVREGWRELRIRGRTENPTVIFQIGAPNYAAADPNERGLARIAARALSAVDLP